MARKTIAEAPVATADQIAGAYIPAVDENDQEVRIPIAKALGGTRLILRQVDRTAQITGRLVSPGNTVAGIAITLSLTDDETGVVTDVTGALRPVTDDNGDFSYTFAGLDAPTTVKTYTVEATAASFLTERLILTKHPLSVFTTAATVSSTSLIGDAITVDVGEGSNSPLEYQVRRLNGSVVIADGDQIAYVIKPIDIGDTIATQVRIRNAGGISAWATAGVTGPIAAKDFTVTTAPTLSGSTALGSTLVVDPGEASENAVPVAFTWRRGGATLRDNRVPKRFYFNYSNETGITPAGDNFTRQIVDTTYPTSSNFNSSSFPAGASSNSATALAGSNEITLGGTITGTPAVGQLVNHANVPAGTTLVQNLGGNLWQMSGVTTGAISGTVSLWSVAESDYWYTLAGFPGALGGSEGPQVYSFRCSQRNNSSTSTRVKFFLARVNAAGVVQGAEAQLTPAGGSTAYIAGSGSGVLDLSCTADFGTFADGDRLRLRQEGRNISATSTNVFAWLIDGTATSYIDMPLGLGYIGLALGLDNLTTRADLAGQSIDCVVTYSNGTHNHTAITNAITLDAAGSPSAAPVNLALPVILAVPPRVGVEARATFGAWTNAPTAFAQQWQVEASTDVWADIAGATGNFYLLTPAEQDKRVRFGIRPTNSFGQAASWTYSSPITVGAPAVYVNYDTGVDTNDGLAAVRAFKTLAMLTSSTVLAGGSVQLAAGSVWNETLPIPRSNMTVEAFGVGAKPIVGKGAFAAIDCYTADPAAYPRNDVLIKGPMALIGNDRCINWRNSSNIRIEDIDMLWTGIDPETGEIVCTVGSSGNPLLENTQGAAFSRCTNIALRRIFADQVQSDGFYFDGCDDIEIADVTILPHQNGAADNIQTRQDGVSAPIQQNIAIMRAFLDMKTRRTASGKGNMAILSIDNVVIEDGHFLGNNFGGGVSWVSDSSCYRSRFDHARLNTYSWLYGYGGNDNYPGVFRHHAFDLRLTDGNRGLLSSGTSVKNYTGPLPFRADIFWTDIVIADTAVGVRIDRPTSALIRGLVLHNVTTKLSRFNSTVLDFGELANLPLDQQYDPALQFIYDGSAPLPTLVSRGTVTGTRRSGQVLTATHAVWDLGPSTVFNGRPVSYSMQWRRLSPTPNRGWRCDWIEGETGLTYTQTDADAGRIVTPVSRIHITMADGTVTDLAWDAAWDSAKRDDPASVAAVVTAYADGSLPPAPTILARMNKVTASPSVSLASWAAGQVVTALTGLTAGSTYVCSDPCFAVSGSNLVTTATAPDATGLRSPIIDAVNAAAINSPKRNWGMSVTIVA